jgi:hypothetical protein
MSEQAKIMGLAMPTPREEEEPDNRTWLERNTGITPQNPDWHGMPSTGVNNTFGYEGNPDWHGYGGQSVNQVKEETKSNERQANSAAWSKGLGSGKVTTEAMSWDDYNALNPQQRAAIDVNTAIASAVAADRASWAANPGRPDDAAEYDADVAGLFGKGGGSNFYAPQTVAVLKQLGLDKNIADDLDNYVSLRSLVTPEDIASLSPDAIAGITPDNVRGQNALTLSTKGQSALAAALATGATLLQAANGQSTFDSVDPAVERLDLLFDSLAQRDAVNNITDDELATTFQSLSDQFGFDNKTYADYFEQRLKKFEYGSAAGQQGVLGSDPGIDYVSPAEFRARYYPNGG